MNDATMLTSTLMPKDLCRLRELFDVASEHPEILQDGLRSEDPQERHIFELVEKMIRAEDDTENILDIDLSARILTALADTNSCKAGDTVSNYRIVQPLGSGGMGTVYLAEALNNRSVKVAVKFMKGRFCSDALFARFAREATILRNLQHPGIARVIESGATEKSIPYLVMEYVDGLPIDQFARVSILSIDARLELFRHLCSAVGYLHQNLVVHRDLKPANVLVTSEGAIKLLDFGLARLVVADDKPTSDPFQSEAAFLSTSGVYMTPEYASPEQVKGQPITTLADVYGLGALLYQLLTGKPAFSAGPKGIAELLLRVCEEEPQKPSLVAEQASARMLLGELDNIVLKAMQKDPRRRYASVEQLDQDVARYLDGLPVLAQGEAFVYRFKKIVSRYKMAVAVAVSSLILLLGGLTATTREARIAERERVRAEEEAEHAKAHLHTAELQRLEAERQRSLAEQQRIEAQLQTSKANRRLDDLQRLSNGLVRAYTTKAQAEARGGRSALLASSVRDLLMILNREGLLARRLNTVLDQASMDAHSYDLTGPARLPSPWVWRSDEPDEYRVGVDATVAFKGTSSLFVRSLAPEPKGSVVISQSFWAKPFRGKRVRLSVSARAVNFSGQSELLLQVFNDDADRSSAASTQLANLNSWTQCRAVVDVPGNADTILIGIRVTGTGTIWTDDFKFEGVSSTVAVTERRGPANLKFQQ